KLSRSWRSIEQHVRMVDRPTAWKKFHPFHVTHPVESQWHNEYAKHFSASGRQCICLCPDDKIGCSKLPALSPVWRRWQIVGIPLRRSLTNPALNQVYFIARQRL